jgi:hypothetical protein
MLRSLLPGRRGWTAVQGMFLSHRSRTSRCLISVERIFGPRQHDLVKKSCRNTNVIVIRSLTSTKAELNPFGRIPGEDPVIAAIRCKVLWDSQGRLQTAEYTYMAAWRMGKVKYLILWPVGSNTTTEKMLILSSWQTNPPEQQISINLCQQSIPSSQIN